MKPVAQLNAFLFPRPAAARHRREVCPASRRSFCAIALLAGMALSTGCMQPHRSNFQVPVTCLRFTAESFTGPCKERSDGKIVCDKVVVTASCIHVQSH
jgi:hypothetical protein